MSSIQALSAVTLATHDMAASVKFYQAAGFNLKFGGGDASFTSFFCGESFLNIVRVAAETPIAWWGRAIFHVTNVDETYQQILAAGYETETQPEDAKWGERYFHVRDPDGHELSFAKFLSNSK